MSRPPPFRFETLASRHQPTAPQIGFRNQRRSAVRRTDPLPAFRKTSEFETSRHKMRMAVSGRIRTPMTPSLSLNQAVRQRRLRAHALATG